VLVVSKFLELGSNSVRLALVLETRLQFPALPAKRGPCWKTTFLRNDLPNSDPTRFPAVPTPTVKTEHTMRYENGRASCGFDANRGRQWMALCSNIPMRDSELETISAESTSDRGDVAGASHRARYKRGPLCAGCCAAGDVGRKLTGVVTRQPAMVIRYACHRGCWPVGNRVVLNFGGMSVDETSLRGVSGVNCRSGAAVLEAKKEATSRDDVLDAWRETWKRPLGSQRTRSSRWPRIHKTDWSQTKSGAAAGPRLQRVPEIETVLEQHVNGQWAK